MSNWVLLDNSFVSGLTQGPSASSYQSVWDSFFNQVDFLVTPYSFLEAVGLNLKNLPKPEGQLVQVGKSAVLPFVTVTAAAYRFYSTQNELAQDELLRRLDEHCGYISKEPFSRWLYQRLRFACEDKSFVDSIHFALAERFALGKIAGKLNAYSDALELLLYCVANSLNGKGYDCFLLIHRLYTLVWNSGEVTHELKKGLKPVGEFKKLQDLMDGESVQALLLGILCDNVRGTVNLYTCESPSILEERLYMAKGAYSLVMRCLNAIDEQKEFKLFPGKVHCVSDLNSSSDLIVIEADGIQAWSSKIEIPERMIEINRWARLIGGWARQYECIRSVHFFGSRVKGGYSEESDLDIAVEVTAAPGDSNALATWLCESDTWKAEVSELLPLKLDLQFYEPSNDTAVVTRGVAEASVLAYYRPGS